MLRITLELEHAAAHRRGDTAAMKEIQSQIEREHGLIAVWLSEDVLVWKRKKVDADFYADSACSVCGEPIEKTGRKGRRPTKCLEHR